MKRRITYVVCALDLAAWLAILALLLPAGADPATAGLDGAAAAGVTALFALTALPAFVLARTQRAPDAALAFALAFPGAFLLLLAMVAFSLP